MNISISPSSLPTGVQQTPPSPEKVEKVRPLFLQRFLLHGAERLELTHIICLCVSTSAAVVGGVLQEWLSASGHLGGGLAGAAGGDAPPLCPVLRVSEAMWRLLCRRGPRVCALAHTHTHHGGIHTHTVNPEK